MSEIFDIQRFADISNSAYDTIINGTAKSEYIYNRGNNVTIYGGEGNDTISSVTDDAWVSVRSSYSNYSNLIDGGEGNDNISYQYYFSIVSDVTITMIGGIGDDRISNAYHGDNAIIDGGEGKDNISNIAADNVTIDGGEGKDYISNSGSSVTINGGAGNDTITNSGSNVTITGGAGDDLIRTALNGDTNIVCYKAGDGNDTLTNSSSNDTINVGGASYSTMWSGDDFVIKVGDGSILLQKADASDLPIIQGTYENSIGTDNNVFVYKSGNDTLTNFKSNDTLSFAANLTGFDFAERDLVLYASEGSVRITEAKNKWVGLADGNGNLVAHALFAEGYEGVIDGRDYTGYELIQGSDNLFNLIYAGAYGSSLYGGTGGNDILYGNVGADEFVYKYGDGQDNFYSIGAEDVVNLNGVNIEQFASVEFTDNGISAKFTDGGSLNINGQAGTFILGGQRFGADFQNKTWYSK